MKTSTDYKKELTFDDLVEEGVKAILRAFGKGEDLDGAVYYIVNGTAQWSYDRGYRKAKDENSEVS